jgi:hypothetical protein
MTDFRLLNSETRKLTRALAEEFHAMEPSPTERELDRKRVEHLRGKADKGHLVTFQWSVAKLGNRRVRMNGQHSSTMLTELNGAFPEDLTVHLDEYEVDSEFALASLFRQFDDRKSSRNARDVAGAYQMLFEPLRDVPRPSAKLAAEGITWYRRFVEGVQAASGDDQYELFNQTGTHAFIRWIGEVLSIKTPELKKAPLIAAMYAGFIASDGDARKFWNDVARGGVEYEDDAPATVLDSWLKALKEEKNGLKPGQYYQGAIFAWNAFREGKPITKSIKYDVSKGFHRVI